MDCLVISYSQPNKKRERHQFFHKKAREGTGFGRYLRLNFVEYDNDMMLPNHLLSIAQKEAAKQSIGMTDEGFLEESDIPTYSSWRVPLLGGLYLCQYLRGMSFDVEVVKHAQFDKDFLDKCLSKGPKVIAISTTLILHPLDIQEIVSYCRKRCPDAFIVLGGQTTWTDYLSKDHDHLQFQAYAVDATVLDSNGFKTLGKIVSCIKNRGDISEVPNLALRQNGSLVLTDNHPEDFDIDKDGMDWDLIEDSLVGGITWLRTQVSCPFRCSFCSFPVTAGLNKTEDIGAVESQLRALEKRGVEYLLFVDDTFNVPKVRFNKLLELLKKFNFKWYSHIRCQFLDADQAKKMKECGCIGAYLGIESANDRILKIMTKDVTVDHYWRGVALLAAEGIQTYGSFIIGYPGETKETILDAKNFIQNSGLDYYATKVFYYDHSTPVRKIGDEYGLSGNRFIWEHDTMTSFEAFRYTEELIQEIEIPYVPQHGGELWEQAYLRERGFSDDQIKALYTNFTKMIQDGFSESGGTQETKRKHFSDIVSAI